MSRSSGRPALVTRHARPSRRWIAALLPRRQSSRCRCDRTWPRPALWASSAARITSPQSAASTRSMYAPCGPSRRSRVRTLCTVPCYRLRSYRGWLDLSDDMRSQDPPSFPHEVVKSGLAPFLSRLWDRDLGGNPWTAAERGGAGFLERLSSGPATECLHVVPLRAQDGLAVAAEPVVEQGRVDPAEVGVELQVVGVE